MAFLFPVILFLFGAFVGSVVNWAIYQLCYFGVRPISPLGLAHSAAQPRTVLDRMPIVGWLRLRREWNLHGRGFWIRPMLIELAIAVFTVWFYYWQMASGLTGGAVELPAGQGEIWFTGHFLLVVLLVTATFIDFDEQTIPDSITLPGTLMALGFAVVFPSFRLPETMVGLAGVTYEHLTFMSPLKLNSQQIDWFENWRGLAVGIVVFGVWCVALMPKICTLRYGVGRGIRIMWASILRPRRRATCNIRTEERGPFGYVYLLLGLWFMLSLVYAWFWFARGEAFVCLLSAVLGLAFGGGIIWAIRLIANSALQQEAMGFGDVTLMAMIGAFLGWQPALLVFGIAPFAALVIALLQFVFTKHRALAYGPYLSLATVLLIINWDGVWNHWAAPGYFAQPTLLLAVLGLFGILSWPMMWGMRLMRGSDSEHEEG